MATDRPTSPTLPQGLQDPPQPDPADVWPHVRPAHLATLHDIVIIRGLFGRVYMIRYYEPGDHPSSPIRNDWAARELITMFGSRWHGVRPGSHIPFDPGARQQ